MKIIFALVTLFCSSIAGLCQQVDYNKIILPQSVNTNDFGEKLVQIAWQNHPSNKLVTKDYEIAKVTLLQTKWSWLEQISASGNLNEFTLNPEQNSNLFFPRYNFGVTIPLGILVSVPTSTKIAQKETEKADLAIKQQKLVLRNLVLKAYHNYLMYEELLKIKSDLVEDEQASFLAVEESFQSGNVSLAEYKEALKAYNAELENQIRAKNDFENAKLEIEMYIGINLEEII